MTLLDPARLPLDGITLIEASAGTGKTYTISNLYLRLLLGDGIERPLLVDEILVLTFTIAATEEIRDRIRARIDTFRNAIATDATTNDEFLGGLRQRMADDNRCLKLLAAATAMMDQAAITTIHGFCSRVLTDQSFTTRTLFDQDLDGDREALLEFATRDCFRDIILSLDAHTRDVALATWPEPASLEDSIRPFLFRENLVMQPAASDLTVLQQQTRSNVTQACELWFSEDVPSLLRDAGFAANSRCIKNLDAMTALCRNPDAANPEDPLWQDYRPAYLDGLKRGTRPASRCLALIEAICAAPTALRASLWHLVINDVRTRLTTLKRALNQLTVDDLLLQLNQAVRDNPALATELAARYPAALVDEFQDTDDIQWNIFRTIYNSRGTLLLIGDPKQAIYQFRGADVFTYINARREAGEQSWSLDTNWRSSSAMISASNQLFAPQGIFGNDRDIPFVPVKPSASADATSFTRDQVPVPALRLYYPEGNEPTNKEHALATVMAFAAEDISRVLTEASRGEAMIGDEPVAAAEIAILVRGHRDAKAARKALAERQIKSVYVTLESVFLQDTADDLRLVLEAVLEPYNERALRSALATRLLQVSATEVAELDDDVVLQQRYIEEFAAYRKIWETRDIAPMIEAMMRGRDLAAKWLHQPGGERQISNLRHLGDLLQQRSAIAPGMHRLLKWYVREKIDADTVASEDRQLRLESDESLVKIVTMHAAKGLEYDIVYIPFAGFFWSQKTTKGGTTLYHEEAAGTFTAQVDLTNAPPHKEIAQREQLAEDTRLLYVGVTRARHQCVIGVPTYKGVGGSAVGRLLGLDGDDPVSVAAALRKHEHYASIEPITGPIAVTAISSAHSVPDLQPPRERPLIDDSWRIHSYTGLSRRLKAGDAESVEPLPVGGFSDDDDGSTAPPASQELVREAFSRFSFPRGPRVGVVLHEVLELLALDTSEAAIEQAAEELTTRLQLSPPAWLNLVRQWLTDILTTPLGTPGFALGDIDAADHIAELEFHFPLADAHRWLDTMNEYGYLEQTAIAPGSLHGMMTGLIDLVIRHDNRYYVLDYKSNDLGANQDSYHAEALDHAVRHHHYDLQYLIYTLALHRFLRARLPSYDYHKHFGGVVYLFLRGMDGSDAAGVFFDRPDATLISRLDAQGTSP